MSPQCLTMDIVLTSKKINIVISEVAKLCCGNLTEILFLTDMTFPPSFIHTFFIYSE